MNPPRKKIALSADGKGGRITAWADISSDDSEPDPIVESVVEMAAASRLSDIDNQLVEVIIPFLDLDGDSYREPPGQNSVRRVISRTKVPRTNQLVYKVQFVDGHHENVSTKFEGSRLP
jgi:aspartate-semialdehyde dehydrogenase